MVTCCGRTTLEPINLQKVDDLSAVDRDRPSLPYRLERKVTLKDNTQLCDRTNVMRRGLYRLDQL